MMPVPGTLEWMYGLRSHGVRLGLETMRELLSRIGDPQDDLSFVHVAGTNGKGSTSAIIESIMRGAGPLTGIYTSPHLVRFNERIRVGGEDIRDDDLGPLLSDLRPVCESMAADGYHPTFFEVATALALRHFSEAGVELAVMEVGLGGRLDATSVISPECTVITPISLEHQRYLGDDLRSIAGEKAGVIRNGVPTITTDSNGIVMDVFEDVCQNVGSSLRIVRHDEDYSIISSDIDGTELRYSSDEYHLALLGGYQAENAALALAAVEELSDAGWDVPETALHDGLEGVEWPGRMQVMGRDPVIMVDVTHTVQGAMAVAPEASRLLGDEIALVIGMLEDKDVEGVTGTFSEIASEVFATAPSTGRSAPVGRVVAACSGAVTTDSVAEAMGMAIDTGAPVLVTGSLYTAGEAIRWLRDSN